MIAQIAAWSPRTLRLIAGGVVFLYALVAWFLIVSPKRADADRAGADLVEAELRLAEAEAAAHRPSSSSVQVSDVFRLAKAMPSSADQAGLMLELTKLADSSGVVLKTVTPQLAAEGLGGATMIPVSVTVEGRFNQITKFLNRVRALVTVRHGLLRAKGRLFGVQSIDLVESASEGFPTLDATVLLQAYVYDGPIAPPESTKPEGDGTLPPTGGATAAGSTG